MLLRSHLAPYSFDSARFERLRADLRQGHLSADRCRLATPPAALSRDDASLSVIPDAEEPGFDRELQASRVARGREALAAGKVAVLVLNGGMATRFGGGAKGTVSVHPDYPHSFLRLKLAQIQTLAQSLGAPIPTVVMHSFATFAPSQEHLRAIDWSGIAEDARFCFSQSIMPRVTPKGEALVEMDQAQDWPDTLLYSAPGHGDTLPRLRDSQVLDTLCERGVEQILISNVDNIAASLDPEILGAHLQAVAQGRQVSIEAVDRRAGEKGGCIAQMAEGPAIVEGFRLPSSCSLDAYPDFNTNTLWCSVQALREPPELTWFPVQKTLKLPQGGELEVIQFEQLIGEATEFIPSHVLCVQRKRRFLPIKTRDDLHAAAGEMQAFIQGFGLAD